MTGTISDQEQGPDARAEDGGPPLTSGSGGSSAVPGSGGAPAVSGPGGRKLWIDLLGLGSVALILMALYGAMIVAPTEAVMGDVQRIFYFHMPSAWVALGPAFTVVFVCSIIYLAKRDLKFDRIAGASAEIGVMFTTITLVTGPLWARPIWGAYWTWDPRLTTTLVLWFIYVAYLMLRSSTAEGHKRARLAAVFGIVGWIDVPIVFMSIRWWRTIHPTLINGQGMQMDPTMQAVLMFSLFAFTILYVYLLIVRVRQLDLGSRVDRLRQQLLMR
ncbi:MAG TPA: cytochrome c biogenesis protein CcsA [Thermoleophilia bacterium]|nr:cytochrome c biogenesis protein CcsA [Thermoleophilia bacterium]